MTSFIINFINAFYDKTSCQLIRIEGLIISFLALLAFQILQCIKPPLPCNETQYAMNATSNSLHFIPFPLLNSFTLLQNAPQTDKIPVCMQSTFKERSRHTFIGVLKLKKTPLLLL